MLNSCSDPLVCTQKTAPRLKRFRASQLRCAPGYRHNDITVLIIGNPNIKEDVVQQFVAAKEVFERLRPMHMALTSPSVCRPLQGFSREWSCATLPTKEGSRVAALLPTPRTATDDGELADNSVIFSPSLNPLGPSFLSFVFLLWVDRSH